MLTSSRIGHCYNGSARSTSHRTWIISQRIAPQRSFAEVEDPKQSSKSADAETPDYIPDLVNIPHLEAYLQQKGMDIKKWRRKEEVYHMTKMREALHAKKWDEIFNQQKLLKSKQLGTNTDHLEMLFHAYNARKNLPEMNRLLERFKELNKVQDWMYEMVLRSKAKYDDIDGMEATWKEMKKSFHPNMELFKVLLQTYERNGLYDKILNLLDNFPLFQLKSTPELWSYMAFMYARAGRTEDAKNLIQKLRDARKQLDSVVLGTLLFFASGNDSETNRINIEMNQRNLLKDSRPYATLIELLQSHDQIDKMMAVFNSLSSKGVKKSADIYGSLLIGLARHKKSAELTRVSSEMIESKLISQRGSQAVLKYLIESGDLQAAEEFQGKLGRHNTPTILRNMAYLYGLQGDVDRFNLKFSHNVRRVEFYNAFLEGLLKKGDFQAAQKILDEIQDMRNMGTDEITFKLKEAQGTLTEEDKTSKLKFQEEREVPLVTRKRPLTDSEKVAVMPRPPSSEAVTPFLPETKELPAMHKRATKAPSAPGSKTSQKKQARIDKKNGKKSSK